MVHRIVLTGGPSSGKTTVIEKIKSVYSAQGIRVFVIEETATYLINKGIRPFGEGAIDLVDFQELVMRMQLAKEDIIDRAISMMPEADTLVIYDRGTIDNSAYINAEQFESVLARLNNVKNFAELMDKYDLVINLVGASKFYTTANNEARSEDAAEAQRLGEVTLKAWIGHPKIKIVPPAETMDGKINEVLNIINQEMQKTPVKRQEKYLVDLSGTELNRILASGKAKTIEQTYLESEDNVEKRIRKITFNGCTTYTLAVYKIREDGTKVIISERQIDEKNYRILLEFKKRGTKTISKTRYYFSDSGEYFYLDVFSDNNATGILEINVLENERVTIPEYVRVLEKVTGQEQYYNSRIAANKDLKKVLE